MVKEPKKVRLLQTIDGRVIEVPEVVKPSKKISKLESSVNMSADDVIEVVTLFNEGTSVTDIAKLKGCSRNTVYKILKAGGWSAD